MNGLAEQLRAGSLAVCLNLLDGNGTVVQVGSEIDLGIPSSYSNRHFNIYPRVVLSHSSENYLKAVSDRDPIACSIAWLTLLADQRAGLPSVLKNGRATLHCDEEVIAELSLVEQSTPHSQLAIHVKSLNHAGVISVESTGSFHPLMIRALIEKLVQIGTARSN